MGKGCSQMIRKNIALCCAGIMLALTAAMPFGASAEETAGGTSVVQVEKSQILVKKSIPASQITGQIAVTVHDHPVQVTIINKTREGNETYYDMEIAPVQDSDSTTYVFPVNQSECRKSEDQGENPLPVYQRDFLQNTYNSAYTVSLSASDDVTYADTNVVIADNSYETGVSGKTTYSYDVVYSEETEEAVTVLDSKTTLIGGAASCATTLQLRWAPYTLGDVNGDGNIDLDDSFAILAYYSKVAAGSQPPADVEAKAANVDGDGAVSLDDAFLVLQYYSKTAAGGQESFPEFLKRVLA
ncbi:dockerin type I domain-containing protein [uncultured Ruminococcus sp.]|uniref:dockerin type I domain-containing protein n=2 Tax=Ruminococcus TaxID=1263 RepID=UPI00266B6CDB|nr:dockerin type I domain-containing protein [uncultured Ruminococcus sp.]